MSCSKNEIIFGSKIHWKRGRWGRRKWMKSALSWSSPGEVCVTCNFHVERIISILSTLTHTWTSTTKAHSTLFKPPLPPTSSISSFISSVISAVNSKYNCFNARLLSSIFVTNRCCVRVMIRMMMMMVMMMREWIISDKTTLSSWEEELRCMGSFTRHLAKNSLKSGVLLKENFRFVVHVFLFVVLAPL